MGGVVSLSLTVTVTLAGGVVLDPITVSVPATGTGVLGPVTIPLGVAGALGDLVLDGIPYPTTGDISITLPGGISVVISVTEVPAP
ncbi:Uncharacterised protein [Streptococcus pneumoniae]|nr:Uncharacterised protein [Streptococcus pneumoniae]